MNIKDAKKQISDAMKAYFTKDEFGNYILPIERQRPVFLIGAPGIGKTAIMEQIAQEMDVGLVSYSMTHHTRQSALGLPFIVHKNYDGMECDVSEYTMSEIISTIYDLQEKTGVKEGILFLDEINCVSETLAPVMLQFLQYKVFGRHKVPDGWIVVTAGNPPEYNNSVREFDIVTWDRLKRIDVEPDYDAWKEYAYTKGIHPAITTYLEIRKSDFYHIENTVDGKQFVTARGWDDLSMMIKLYESNGIDVDEKLIAQYIQSKKIAKQFATYYALFNKYRSDYQINMILEGESTEEILRRADEAKFDERLSLVGLILDGINSELKDIIIHENLAYAFRDSARAIKKKLMAEDVDPATVVSEEIDQLTLKIDSGTKAGNISGDKRLVLQRLIKIYNDLLPSVTICSNGADAFNVIKKKFEEVKKELTDESGKAGVRLTNAFKFIEEAFSDGQEMLIFVTELTINYYASTFISKFGCEEYFKHNKNLLFFERQRELMNEIESLDDI